MGFLFRFFLVWSESGRGRGERKEFFSVSRWLWFSLPCAPFGKEGATGTAGECKEAEEEERARFAPKENKEHFFSVEGVPEGRKSEACLARSNADGDVCSLAAWALRAVPTCHPVSLSLYRCSFCLPYLKTAFPVSDSVSTVSSGGWDATSHHLREEEFVYLFIFRGGVARSKRG